MAYFGTFAIMALIPFAVGFASTGLWRRWGALVPVAAVVLYLGIIGYGGAAAGDGPGVAVGLLLAWFFILGTVTGIAASTTVLTGRVIGSKTLRPTLTIPVIFAIGFGCPMAFYFFHSANMSWKMSSPGLACIDRHYPARIGDVDLLLPAAPGIKIFEKVGYRSFGMWHNPDLRYLCSRGDGERLEIRDLSFMVRETIWSTHEAKGLFCSRPHPEYPWALWVCDPKAGDLNLPDRPSSVAVTTVDPAASSRKPKPLPDFPVTISPDGSKVYRSGDDVVVLTPNGDRVECGRIGRDRDLYCGGDGSLSEGLVISYSFWADGIGIERTVPIMAASARGYFRSVVQ
jgi:hypothetical protein